MKRGIIILVSLVTLIILMNFIDAAEPDGVRISPVNSSSKAGEKVAFVSLYSDLDGYDDINETRVRFMGIDGNKNRVVLRYHNIENKVYMRDDTDLTWIGGNTPLNNEVLENSYATIDVSRIIIDKIDADKLKVRWPLTFNENFTGNYSIQLYVDDGTNKPSWKNIGTWVVKDKDDQEMCIPKTCSELGKTCGTFDDGCGNVVDCGVCDGDTEPPGEGEVSPTCTDSDNDGYNSNGGSCGEVDCNDQEASANPGGNELCNDNTDNNCNGIIDEGCGVGGSINQCSGCLSGNSCYSIGVRFIKDNEPGYCDIDKIIKSQKNLESNCDNNFECQSNECSGGKCVILEEEIKKLRSGVESLEEEVKNVKSEISFFKKLLCSIKDFLGIEGYDECILIPRPSTNFCGNDNCETGETCSSCSQDCGVCPDVCADSDNDGYGNPDSNECTYPQLDCNDNNNEINPGVSEVCTNNIDDDCDGLIDSVDTDCKATPVCGNNICETGESCSSCSKDCGSCPLPTPLPTSKSIWISKEEIMALPMSGAAWTNVKSQADQSACTPDLSNQDDSCNVRVLAKALVYARTGDTKYLNDVKSALTSIANSGTYNGRALALGRELGAYVISADIIELKNNDPALDSKFRNKIKELLTTSTTGGPSSLIDCHEDRPNNWGTNCGASRIAVDLYLGETTDLEKAAKVFKGWVGDRASYAGFNYGELSWQCDPTKPVGINPQGCLKNGHSIDGVLPDDQRRGSSFTWPPPKENYVWGALGGAVIQAELLNRAGYDSWNWENKALLRAVQWLHNEADFPAAGDDSWTPWFVNHAYGTSFPAQTSASSGKNMGWTDWTHAK